MTQIREYAYLEVRAIKELSSFLIVLSLLVLVGCSATSTPATTTTTVTIASTTTTTVSTTTTLYSGLYYASSKSDAFHYAWCYYVDAILPENLVAYTNREWALAAGKYPCSYCKP